ncbi:hypothetical protein MMC29_000718 [Neofusicoccum parvum]|uniref:Uncharacterized protein n=1 Tax=Neofusicoccum parvum TaxID=310453 RepID=A0ACB5SA88_9PEZI|nr:hypothetical protein MMC29_000718 [Neofusicoccum parvum]
MPPPAVARPPHPPPTHCDADRVAQRPRTSFSATPATRLHHETARIACAVVAANRWDGFLAADAAGAPLDAGPDDILAAREYYFHVPGLPQYPVVPSFREWRFPHDELPAVWQAAAAACEARVAPVRAASDLSTALALRDGSCRMSGCEETCRVAHLVPRQEEAWFDANAMLLRADLHLTFDQMQFVFVPKPLPPGEPWCPFVVHLLDPLARELCRLYHNVPLQAPLGVTPEYLFARFAWAVFPFLEDFLRHPVARKLLVASDPDPITLSPQKCALFTRQARRSRSASPKKRGRSAVAEDDDPQEEETEDAEPLPPRRKKARCSPRASPSAASAAKLHNNESNDPPHLSGSQATASDDEFDSVCKAHLEQERQRSDPSSAWKAEQDWLAEAVTRPLAQSELRRYWEARGYDVLEEADLDHVSPHAES